MDADGSSLFSSPCSYALQGEFQLVAADPVSVTLTLTFSAAPRLTARRLATRKSSLL